MSIKYIQNWVQTVNEFIKEKDNNGIEDIR